MKKALFWVVGSLFVLAASGYGYVRFDLLAQADKLDAEIAKAKSFGLPLVPKDMDRRSMIDPKDNAADEYAACGLTMKAPGVSSLEAAYNFDAIINDNDFRNRYRKALADFAPTLERVRSASARKYCAFNINWEDAPYSDLIPTFALKRFIKLLSAEAIVFAQDGEWDRAMENVLAIGRITRHAGEDRMIISLLISVAYDAIVNRVIEVLATIAGKDLTRLEKLRAVVANFPPTPPFRHYLEGEVFFGYWTARNLRRNWVESKRIETEDDEFSLTAGVNEYEVFPPLIEHELVQRASAAEILGFWNETFRLLKVDKVSEFKIHEQMDRLVTEIERNSKPWRKSAAMTVPVYSSTGTVLLKAQTEKACEIGLIDVLIYRAKNGQLPETLDEAVNQTTDSFTGSGLKYTRTSTGFRVYSIGSGGKDLGGLTPTEWNEKQKREKKSDFESEFNFLNNVVAVFPSVDRLVRKNSARNRTEANKHLDEYEKRKKDSGSKSPSPSR